MIVLTVEDVIKIIKQVGIKKFSAELVEYLEKDFKNWEHFTKIPRPAAYSPYGVIEVMPASNSEFYGFKYVNGHPGNPKHKLPTVMGTGQLSHVQTGEPILYTEMTILTAIRTAATSAMAGKYLARKDSSVIGFIGTGAQSEFQLIAFLTQFNIKEVRYYDIDYKAMEKFGNNIKNLGIAMTPVSTIDEVVNGADIISTMTATKEHVEILKPYHVRDGIFINAIGGDSPGKTEIAEEILKKSKIFVEHIPQTLIEGEIQKMGRTSIQAELWEVIAGIKQGRVSDTDITLFDSVGFAIEDFSALRLIHDYAKKFKIGNDMEMVPEMDNPKDLFGYMNK